MREGASTGGDVAHSSKGGAHAGASAGAAPGHRSDSRHGLSSSSASGQRDELHHAEKQDKSSKKAPSDGHAHKASGSTAAAKAAAGGKQAAGGSGGGSAAAGGSRSAMDVDIDAMFSDLASKKAEKKQAALDAEEKRKVGGVCSVPPPPAFAHRACGMPHTRAHVHPCALTLRFPPPPLQRAAAAEAAREDALRAREARGKASNRIKGEDSPEPLRFDPVLGLPIYSAKQLKIGQGAGDTELCPFDCDCCF
jgi:hypothetical protein